VQLTDVIKRVQRIFGDEDEVQISVQDVISWASDGQMEIARQTECLTKDVQFDFDPATYTGFALPSDFILEKRIAWTAANTNPKPLSKTTLELMDQQGNDPIGTGDSPSSYYMWAGKINVWPIATAAKTNSLRLWYVCSPQPLVQIADQFQIPIYMHEDIVRYALMRARELNEDVEQADRMGADLTSRLVQSRSEAFNPYKDQFPVIRDDPGDNW